MIALSSWRQLCPLAPDVVSTTAYHGRQYGAYVVHRLVKEVIAMRPCANCDGTGQITRRPDEEGLMATDCPLCDGTGNDDSPYQYPDDMHQFESDYNDAPIGTQFEITFSS
jgi:hypothetical protein